MEAGNALNESLVADSEARIITTSQSNYSDSSALRGLPANCGIMRVVHTSPASSWRGAERCQSSG
jgi:hypothetical protein